MKLNRKKLRKLILQEMRMQSQSSDEPGQQNVFSIRLLSPSPGYFMDQVHYLKSAEREFSMPSLFDMLDDAA